MAEGNWCTARPHKCLFDACSAPPAATFLAGVRELFQQPQLPQLPIADMAVRGRPCRLSQTGLLFRRKAMRRGSAQGSPAPSLPDAAARCRRLCRRLPQGLPLRKADPGRIRIHEQMPEGAKEDGEYMKMVQDVRSIQHPAGLPPLAVLRLPPQHHTTPHYGVPSLLRAPNLACTAAPPL